MKHLLLCIGLFFSLVAIAQTKEDVSLVVFGEGKTKDEAINRALRSAIEQAYGSFVSANTTILNDDILTDEIVSLSSGNIKSFKVLAVTDIPEEQQVLVSLQAEVSIGALVSFAQAHGSEAEFSGQTFLFNIKKRKLDIQNEPSAIYHLCQQSYYLLQRAYDYDVSLGEPRVLNDNAYSIGVDIKATPNNNFYTFIDFLITTLSSITLTPEEANSWELNMMNTYQLSASLNAYDSDGIYMNRPYIFHLRALNKSLDDFLNLGRMLYLSPASFFLRVKLSDQEHVYGPYASDTSQKDLQGVFHCAYHYTIKPQGETSLKYAADLKEIEGLWRNKVVIDYNKKGEIILSSAPIVFHMTLFFTEEELSKLVSISVEEGSKKPIIYFFRLNYT